MPPPPGHEMRLNFFMDVLKDKLNLTKEQTEILYSAKKNIENAFIASKPKIKLFHEIVLAELDKEKINRQILIEHHMKITDDRIKTDLLILNKLLDAIEKLDKEQKQKLKAFMIEEFNKMNRPHNPQFQREQERK